MNVSGLMTRTGRVVARASKQVGQKIKSAIRPASKAEQTIDLKQPLQTIPEGKKFRHQPEPTPVDDKPKTQTTRLPLQDCVNEIHSKKVTIMKRKIRLIAEKNEQNEQNNLATKT